MKKTAKECKMGMKCDKAPPKNTKIVEMGKNFSKALDKAQLIRRKISK